MNLNPPTNFYQCGGGGFSVDAKQYKGNFLAGCVCVCAPKYLVKIVYFTLLRKHCNIV